MKIYKNIYIALLIIVISIICLGNLNVLASDISKSDNNNATWKINEKTTNVLNGVTHSLMYGETTDKSESVTGMQKVNLFEMKADGINSKLVTWAISGKTTYSRAGLSAIAKDYEKNHPGWIVVAGINGDQYYAKYGNGLGADGSFYYYNQPYYPMIIGGERRFAITPSGTSSSNYVGIVNDEKSTSIIKASALESLKVEVLDENNNVIYIHNVEHINENPQNEETSIWITYNSTENSGEVVEHNVKSNNNLYVVEDAELAYMNNSITYPHGTGFDSLFARGTINLITDKYTFSTGSFGIETNNEKLKQQLNKDVKIRVQFYYENEEMNKVESSMGYHSIQRNDNKDIESSQPYDTRRYNRSIFGRKADGTYVLMTVAKGEYSGTTHNESNAILKQFGVTEAYQQDGGGSVTAIIRNENDEFDIVNASSDSGSKERSIFNGCFFVVRDLGYRAYQKDSTKNSITLTKVYNYNDEYISNVKAVINNKTYEINNDTLTIENLEYDKQYVINLMYDVTINGKTVKATQQIIGHTDSFTMPPSGIKVVKITANSIILERRQVSLDEVVFAEVKIENQTFDLKEANKQIEINNLSPSTIYSIEIHYAVKDSVDGRIYEEFEKTVQMTKKYNVPEIKTFEIVNQTKNSIEIKYEIIDDFNMGYAYYISCNGNQIDCENLSATIIIEDVNLKKNEYEISLVVQYKEENNYKSINSDILKTTKITSGCNKNNSIYINLILSSLLLYINLKKRK